MRPVLVAIDGDEPKSHAQIRDIVAPALGVSDEDRQVMLPSGTQALFTNRVAWAITHMTQAGLLDRPERGRYLLTERGQKVLHDYPDRVDMAVLSQFPEYHEFRARKSGKHLNKSVAVVADEVSPSESIGQIVEESYEELAAELLDRIWRSRRRSWRPCRSGCCARWGTAGGRHCSTTPASQAIAASMGWSVKTPLG